MRLTDIFKFKLFDRTDKADLDVVNENFQNVETALNTCKQDLSNHKSSGDHDSRYLQKSAVINNNTTTEAGYALDARQANPNVSGSLGAQINLLNRGLIEHKTSGDHDSRYYTEAEMDGKLSGKSDTTHNHDGRYLQKSAVINSNTVTETGYALDARQANPNVSGSLGAQINSLNTNLAMKQDASTAITTSNIGSQSVNYASSSGVANTAVYGVDDNTGHDTDFFMSRSNTAGYRKNNSSFFDRNGIYCTDVNTEYANDWGVILTLRAPGVDWMFQVWFKTNGDIFVRRSINTGTHNFTAWKQISIVA